VRPLQGVGDTTGVGEDLAEIPPDQIVELPRRGVAGGAIFVPAGPGPLLLAGADVVPAVAQRLALQASLHLPQLTKALNR